MHQCFFRFIFLQLLLWSIPQGLRAQVDPGIEWKEIETNEAYWLFDAKHQHAAQYYISQFERAKAKVTPLFKEGSRKVTFLLLDNTDIANGSAQVTPQPLIILLMVNPASYSSIGEFKDNTYELLIHEYTHILNMEPVHGWIRPFYWVFGSTAHPNMLLPRWYTEGLAVYTESALSDGGGRLNSQYLQGLARSLTLSDLWTTLPLSQLNDYHPDPLGGSRAYLFGGILWDNITQNSDPDVIWKMNQSYSRRIPYLLDGVLEDQTGKTYEAQLQSAYNFWQNRAQTQLQTITSQPTLAGYRFEHPDKASDYYPRISPDGLWMISLRDDRVGRGHIQLRVRHPKKGFSASKPEDLIRNTYAQSLEWHPAGTGFLFERLDRNHRYNRFFDLYFYDLNSKKETQVTHGARAHHACFSPKGDMIYYLVNKPAGKDIVAQKWPDGTPETIYQSSLGDDLRYLNCPNQDQLLFLEQKAGSHARLSTLMLADKSHRVLFDKAPLHFLRSTHLGFLVGSSKSGVENLYLIRLRDKITIEAVTNTLTRTQQGDIDPLEDQLYVTQADGVGTSLYQYSGAEWESLADTPPSVDSLFVKPKTLEPKEVVAAPQDPNTALPTATSFSPWRYLYPRHWIPFMYLVDGGELYQAITSASDPMGINQISLIGQWDTLTKKPGVSFSYLNNSLPVSLGLGASDVYNYFFNTGTTLHFSNLQFVSAFNIASQQQSRLLFRWAYSSLDLSQSSSTEKNFFIRQGPQVELNLAKLTRQPDDISISSGWRYELGHKQFLADLGNTSYGETYSHLGTYWSSFTPKRHVLYLGFNGSYAPQLNNRFFATSTLAGPFQNPQITNTSFLQRGYPTGIFVARNILNTNMEYRFPIGTLFRGYTQPPVFIKNLQGSFVFDTSTLDGSYSDFFARASRPTEFGRWFTGYGLELETNVQVGFHVPITLTLGFYYGQEHQAFGGFNTFFNIRL